MTKKILAGSAVLFLITIGLTAQSFAMPMEDKKQNDVLVKTMNGNLQSNGQEYILVSVPPTHKGGHATFQLIPKPILNADGVIISTPSESSQMMLVGVSPAHSGGTVTYHWIPKPAPNSLDESS